MKGVWGIRWNRLSQQKGVYALLLIQTLALLNIATTISVWLIIVISHSVKIFYNFGFQLI